MGEVDDHPQVSHTQVGKAVASDRAVDTSETVEDHGPGMATAAKQSGGLNDPNQVDGEDVPKVEIKVENSSAQKSKSSIPWFSGPRYYYDSWVLEVGAVITSIASAVAIIAILGAYDGKASPDVAMGLTLNSIISILATTSRVSLVYAVSNSLGQAKWLWFGDGYPRSVLDLETFDNASRGPLGALGLFWSRPRRSLASLGALVIILTLVFDPFVQQVVRFDSRLIFVPSDKVSTLRANFLAVDGAVSSTARAINSAFWTDEFRLQTSCPSGNCTFPPFSSVGWCSSCQDDTESWTLSRECNLTLGGEDLKQENLFFISDCSVTSYDNLTITFPIEINWNISEMSIKLSAQWPRIKTSLLSDIGDAEGSFRPWPETYQNRSLPMATTQTATLDFQFLGDASGLGPSALFRSTTCELNLCMRDLNISTSSGATRVIPTRSQILQVSGQEIVFSNGNNGSFICWEVPASHRVDFNNYIGSPFPQNMPNSQYDNRYLLYEDGSFCVQRSTLPDMFGWSNVFGGQLIGAQQDSVVNSSIDVYFPLAAYDPTITTSVFNSTSCNISAPCYDGVCQCDGFYYIALNLTGLGKSVVWNQTGPENILENVAASLNLLMVDSSTNPNATSLVHGQEGVFVTYVEVRWPWLTLPFALMLGGIAFLLSTIYQGRRIKAPLWKSSVNALLYHGLEEETSGGMDQGRPATAMASRTSADSSLTTIREMNIQAASTRARLTRRAQSERMVLMSSHTGGS